MEIFRRGSFGYMGMLRGVAESKELKTTVLDKLSPLIRFGYFSLKAWGFFGIIYLIFKTVIKCLKHLEHGSLQAKQLVISQQKENDKCCSDLS